MESLGAVRKVVGKNHCHLTVYAFCRHGGLFDQQPVKRAEGLIPRKSGLPTEKYGGYNKPGASFFALALCTYGKKREVMLLPVERLVVGKYDADEMFAKEYLRSTAEKLLGKKVEDISFPLGMRKLKINTVFEADGFRMCLSGKSSGGQKVGFKPLMPLILSPAWETYIKKLETFDDKKAKNTNISYDPDHEVLTPEKNAELYRVLADKITKKPFKLRPTLVLKKIVEKEEKFTTLSFDAQVKTLLTFVSLFARFATKDDFLDLSGSCEMSSKLSNWKKYYQSVCIVDSSASGIWESQSRNLLSFL